MERCFVLRRTDQNVIDRRSGVEPKRHTSAVANTIVAFNKVGQWHRNIFESHRFFTCNTRQLESTLGTIPRRDGFRASRRRPLKPAANARWRCFVMRGAIAVGRGLGFNINGKFCSHAAAMYPACNGAFVELQRGGGLPDAAFMFDHPLQSWRCAFREVDFSFQCHFIVPLHLSSVPSSRTSWKRQPIASATNFIVMWCGCSVSPKNQFLMVEIWTPLFSLSICRKWCGRLCPPRRWHSVRNN